MGSMRSSRILGILISFAVIIGGFSVWNYLSDPENPMSYIGFIVTVFFIIAAMSVHISQSSWNVINIAIKLEENAREIVLTNVGNSPAFKIHVSLVPLNVDFDIPGLLPDEEYRFPLNSMLENAKAVVTFEGKEGVRFQKTAMLSALGPDEDDLLKPMFPLFRWKSGP